MRNLPNKWFLFITTIIVAICSIIYELLLAQTLTVIFWWNVIRYSITIGLYLFALWIGTMAYDLFKKNPLKSFIIVELILSICWGFAVALIFILTKWQFDHHTLIFLVTHFFILVIGFLSWLEIPLLVNLIENSYFSKVLSLDYFWSLIWSLLFWLFLHNTLWLIPTWLIVGFINLSLAIYFSFYLKNSIKLRIFIIAIWACFLTALINYQLIDQTIQKQYKSDLILYDYYKINKWDDDFVKRINKIETKRTKYQEITYAEVLVHEYWEPVIDKILFLDNKIQLGDIWIDQYHQAFWLWWILYSDKKNLNIAILWWWDLILASEILKFPQVKKIDLVDIDKEFVNYMTTHPFYSKLNSLANSKKLNKITGDAYLYMKEFSSKSQKKYDIVFVDLSNLKNNDKLIHLYSEEFYSSIAKSLTRDWIMLTWVYPDYRHQEVIRKSTAKAWFNKYNHYCAYYKQEIDSPSKRCIQNFFIFGFLEKQQNTNDSYSDYQKKLIPLFSKWKTNNNSLFRSNSIFKPNYEIVARY